MLPLLAPWGIWAVIVWPSPATVTEVACFALLVQLFGPQPNFTVALGVKLVPVIVTEVPTTPEFELNEVIVGAGEDASTVKVEL
jgi:hypothetical protein